MSFELFLVCFLVLVVAQGVLLFAAYLLLGSYRRSTVERAERAMKSKAAERYMKKLERKMDGHIDYHI